MITGRITFYWPSGATVTYPVGERLVGIQIQGERPEHYTRSLDKADGVSALDSVVFMQWLISACKCLGQGSLSRAEISAREG